MMIVAHTLWLVMAFVTTIIVLAVGIREMGPPDDMVDALLAATFVTAISAVGWALILPALVAYKIAEKVAQLE